MNSSSFIKQKLSKLVALTTDSCLKKATYIFFLQFPCNGNNLIFLSLFFLFESAKFIACMVDLQNKISYLTQKYQQSCCVLQ